MQGACIAVGLPVARQPPHKSRRAELPHRAFQKYSHPRDSLFGNQLLFPVGRLAQFIYLWARKDSNLRPSDYESPALTTAPRARFKCHVSSVPVSADT